MASAMTRPRKAKKLKAVKPTRQMAYQWASTDPGGPIEELQRYLDAGWKVSRHRAQRAKNIPRGTVLLEIPRDIHRRMVQADIDRAKEQMLYADKLIGKGEGHPFSMVTVVSEHYERVPSDAEPIAVPITVNFLVPAEWQDTANALKLTPAEYARRRVLMNRSILAPARDFSWNEDDDVAYEPCELTLTRKHT